MMQEEILERFACNLDDQINELRSEVNELRSEVAELKTRMAILVCNLETILFGWIGSENND